MFKREYVKKNRSDSVLQMIFAKKRPEILLVTAFLTALIITVAPGSVNGSIEMQEAEIGP